MNEENEHPVWAAYQQEYCEALGDRLGRPNAERSYSSELEVAQWKAILSVLRAYISRDNLKGAYKPSSEHHGSVRPRESFPPEVAIYLATVVEEMLTGKLPQTIKALSKNSTPKYGPNVKGAIVSAVRYANLANAGLIIERAPVKRVEDLFGIKRQTWKDWRRLASNDETDPFKFYPQLGENISKRTSLAQADLARAAKIYADHGRGDTSP